MEGLIFFLIYFGLPLLGLAIALFGGNLIAAAHERSLLARRQHVAHIRTSDMRLFFDATPGPKPAMLVTSEVTLGIDHFRGFLGQLKNIFGGEVRSYQTTLDRARREAITRIVEQAHAEGFNAVANLRVEFADIGGNATSSNKASMVTILASGTAYHASTPAHEPVSSPPQPNAIA